MSTPSTPGVTPGSTLGTPVPPPGPDLGSHDHGSATGGTGQQAKQQAGEVAGTAAEQGKQVAGFAKDEARVVLEEGKQQARGLLDEARSEIDQQSRTQRDRLAGTLHTLGDDLESMAGDGGASPGLAQDLVRQASQHVRELSGRLDGREPTEILDDVRAFARRRPGTFLLGALAAGVVAGRLTRGTKDASSAGTSTGSGRDVGTSTLPAVDPGIPSGGPYAEPAGVSGTATGDPLAGVGTPETEPVDPEAPLDDPRLVDPRAEEAGREGTVLDDPLGRKGTS